MQEHEHMHRLPKLPHTLCFGQTRKVDRQATVSVGDAIYSVPHQLIGERVWVRADGEQLVVVRIDHQGPHEVARHQLTTPGRPSIDDAHYPPRPAGALERRPRARSTEEREFLAIGDGAERWLKRAAAEGTSRIRRKMAEAVDLSKLHGTGPVNNAFERCSSYGRLADGDLARILAHQQVATVIPLPTGERSRSVPHRRPPGRYTPARTRGWPSSAGCQGRSHSPPLRASPARPTPSGGDRAAGLGCRHPGADPAGLGRPGRAPAGLDRWAITSSMCCSFQYPASGDHE
jgi:hypothetical protein